MAGKIAGEVVIVTGASSGIGAATVQELAKRGARLVLAARRADELTQMVEGITGNGGEALAVPSDVSDQAQLAQLVERAQAAYGRIDALVNNAGIGSGKALAQADIATIQRTLDVNLVAPILLTRLVLPGMLERKHGRIISVASVAAHVATEPMYSATKFGVRGFTVSLNRQLRGSGVTASVVSPGYIRTPLTAGRTMRMPGPEIIARAIASLIERPRREVIAPGYYRLPIWAEEIVPWLLDRALPRNR